PPARASTGYGMARSGASPLPRPAETAVQRCGTLGSRLRRRVLRTLGGLIPDVRLIPAVEGPAAFGQFGQRGCVVAQAGAIDPVIGQHVLDEGPRLGL